MQTFRDWIVAAIIVAGFLAIFSYDDGMEDQQRASEELKAAQVQAKVEVAKSKRDLKQRIAEAHRLLALENLK